MNASDLLVHEALLPPGYVVLERFTRNGVRLVHAALPDENGILWVEDGRPRPAGWRFVGYDGMVGPRGSDMLAPGPTWRAWALYFAARRNALRAVQPVAARLILVLARLACVEIPMGCTLRGALRAMGAAVEAERRRV